MERPPADPEKAQVETQLEVTAVEAMGADIFTNARPLWQPPGARGIFGGAVIAQCLAAAQSTVTSAFFVHSMHCYFMLAGDAAIPILYHVDRIRDGKSFLTRTVQARQRDVCIFTAIISFTREDSESTKVVSHAPAMPDGLSPPSSWGMDPFDLPELEDDSSICFQSRRIRMINEGGKPNEKKTRQWIRAKGKISRQGGHNAHLTALAFLSDSYFIGTIAQVHNLWRFQTPPQNFTPQLRAYIKRVKEFEGYGHDLENAEGRSAIQMIVSLDHSIYFYEPRKVKADEWMFSEMESPWAGEGRGLVTQKIFTSDGTLVATCVQEGLVRLVQEPKPKKASL